MPVDRVLGYKAFAAILREAAEQHVRPERA